jgi:hypothetical protein
MIYGIPLLPNKFTHLLTKKGTNYKSYAVIEITNHVTWGLVNGETMQNQLPFK